MRIRQLLLIAVCAFSSMNVSAEDLTGDFIHIKTSKGWELIDLSVVDRISFKGDNMVATDKDNNTVASFPKADLERMFYSETSGVQKVEADDEAASFAVSADGREVRMVRDGEFAVYNVAGQLLASIPEVKAGECISLAGLGKGVVIVKSGKDAAKVILK